MMWIVEMLENLVLEEKIRWVKTNDGSLLFEVEKFVVGTLLVKISRIWVSDWPLVGYLQELEPVIEIVRMALQLQLLENSAAEMTEVRLDVLEEKYPPLQLQEAQLREGRFLRKDCVVPCPLTKLFPEKPVACFVCFAGPNLRLQECNTLPHLLDRTDCCQAPTIKPNMISH
jgi:hypothetical protein